MEVIVCNNYQEVSMKAANYVIKEIILNPETTLGLATGSTPIGLYQNLIDAYRNNLVSFEDVHTFNLDEYIGLPKDHPQSYYSFMYHNLFKHININLNNVNMPENESNNLDYLAKEYNNLLCNNTIDLQILGIGSNGHIGFNEPGTPLSNETFIVELDEQTRLDNSRFFMSIDEVPTHAITMGIKNIMRSKKIILIATGDSKKEALYKAVNGEINSSHPASILQLHPNCVVICDQEAGTLLEKKTL